jgi:hypothetical protein
MVDIYIVTAFNDRPTARVFAQLLKAQGYSVAPKFLASGTTFTTEDVGPEDARCVIALWSQASCNSKPVRADAKVGAANGRLVELMLGPFRPKIEGTDSDIVPIDFSQWDGSANGAQWKLLSQRVRALAGAKGVFKYDTAFYTQSTLIAALILICGAAILSSLRMEIQGVGQAQPANVNSPVTGSYTGEDVETILEEAVDA